MRIFRLFWDKDKQERWFNEMAAKGWALKDFFLGIYHFEESEKGEYIYQIDLLERNKYRRRELKEMFPEQGVEIIDEWGRWIFLKKKAAEGSFPMYTDNYSKKVYYRWRRNIFGTVFVLELVCLMIEVLSAAQAGAWSYWLPTACLGLITFLIGSLTAKFYWKVKELER